MTVTELLPYDDALAAFDPVMGLEVHVELRLWQPGDELPTRCCR